MPLVFVIAEDWKLRAGVRAELRERGIHALGMESAADAGQAIARGEMPAVIVLDAASSVADDPAVQRLANHVPTVLIASRTRKIAPGSAAKILFRPLPIREIVSAVLALLKGLPA